MRAGADVSAITSVELAGVPAGSTPLEVVAVRKARHALNPKSSASYSNPKVTNLQVPVTRNQHRAHTASPSQMPPHSQDHKRFDETIAALKRPPSRGFGVKIKGAVGWRRNFF